MTHELRLRASALAAYCVGTRGLGFKVREFPLRDTEKYDFKNIMSLTKRQLAP